MGAAMTLRVVFFGPSTAQTADMCRCSNPFTPALLIWLKDLSTVGEIDLALLIVGWWRRGWRCVGRRRMYILGLARVIEVL